MALPHLMSPRPKSTKSVLQRTFDIFTYTPACRPTRQRRAGTPFCFLGRSESALRRGFRLRETPRARLVARFGR